jgi:hypothetical protein
MRFRFVFVFLAAGLAACRGGSDPVGSVSLDPNIVHLGYPQSVAVRFRWRPVRELDRRHGSPVVFVHLLDRTGQTSTLLRTFDHPLPKPWTAGQPQDDEIDIYQSALADPLPPGRYILSLGLYDDSWGYRWPLTTGPEVARREYSAASVEVSGPDPSAPKFSFVGDWQPIEAVATRQVLAHRCLAGPATLSVGEIRAPGILRLQWTISFGLALATTCETGRDEKLGQGRPWVGIRLPVSAGGGRCEVRVDPVAPPANVPAGSSVATCLEVLSWRPDPAPAAGSRP